MSKKEEAEYEEYENLKNSKFKQQKMAGWRPVPSMARTVVIFFVLGIVFVGLGVLILLFSNEIVEKIQKYDCETNICTIEIKIEKEMKKNIMVYYQLDGFYQNHRRYVKSKSIKQLNGSFISKEEMSKSQDCDPVVTNEDMGQSNSIENTSLVKDEVAIPCGLMAKHYFNDNFTKWTITNSNPKREIIVNTKNISRKSDRNKFRNQNKTKQWLDIEDEHFIVWMRPAPLPNFTKLWGRIEEDIEKDSTLEVVIENNYNVTPFNGSKYLVLRTVNNFGGNNIYLAIGYIAFGGVCLILGIIFFIGYKAHQKKEK